jgi:predicted ATPase
LFREVTFRNLLSFGPEAQPIALERLNILIGPNGSGKSNFIEAIALLNATPGDLHTVIRRGGGVREWIWKGEPKGAAALDVVVHNPHGTQPLRHVLAFREENQVFRLDDERIENEHPNMGRTAPYFFYRYQQGRPVLNIHDEERRLVRETFASDASILAQRRDPEAYPEVSYLARAYEKIRVYREWTFGRNTVFREPQKADMRNDRLEEDFSNLGLVLNRLRRTPKAKSAILEGLRDLYEGFSDFDVSVEGGTVQVFFTEEDFTIPATRLSDGTLRYLCLLAILCDPEPPPLICLEEPELGLHPDMLPKIADLLISASTRTQLIVTTHSDILVDAVTERPEAILVCEKHAGQTVMRRLDAKRLAHWLEKYRLGELWTRGDLGGTRW